MEGDGASYLPWSGCGGPTAMRTGGEACIWKDSGPSNQHTERQSWCHPQANHDSRLGSKSGAGMVDQSGAARHSPSPPQGYILGTGRWQSSVRRRRGSSEELLKRQKSQKRRRLRPSAEDGILRHLGSKPWVLTIANNTVEYCISL